MIELGFVLALELAGLAVAASLMLIGARPATDPSARRVVTALERATLAFQARERWAVAAVGSAAALALGVWHATAGHPMLGLLAALGVLSGAALATAVAGLAARVAARATGGMLDAARDRLTTALAAGLRSAGGIALAAETTSTLGALSSVALGALLLGGSGETAESSLLPALRAALPAYALGGSLSAALLGRAAGTYRIAARAGFDRALELEQNPSADDAKNPALIADRVGQLLEASARSALFFAGSALFSAAVFSMASASDAPLEALLRTATLPLMVRSFGLVGCVSGILTARSEEARDHGLAFTRGHLSAASIAMFGALGASYWIDPVHFGSLVAASALGFAAFACGPLFAASLGGARKGDGASGSGFDGLESSGRALPRAAVALCVALACAFVATRIAANALAPLAGRFALSTWAAALLALTPLALTVHVFSAISRGARGVEALCPFGAESRLRLQRLDDVGFRAKALTESSLIGAAALAVLLVAPILTGPAGDGALPVLGLALAAAAGLASLFGPMGVAVSGAASGARELRVEVDRQLALPRSPGGISLGAETGAPSYRFFEEHCVRVARTGPLGAARQLIVPVLLGSGLGLVYRVGSSRFAALTLATIVVLVAVTAFGAALAVDGARATQTGTRRVGRPERDTAGVPAPVGDGLANILGSAAAPTACTQAIVVASLALCLLQLLT